MADGNLSITVETADGPQSFVAHGKKFLVGTLALSNSGCPHTGDLSAVVDMSYALKGHTTPIRSQGNHGTLRLADE